MTIGERIQQSRKAKKLSQEALAEALNVSRQTVFRWESGESIPTAENLARLSRVCGVSMDALLNGEPPAQEPAPKEAEVPAPEPVAAQEPKSKKKLWVYILAALLLAAAVAVGGFLLWTSFNGSIPIEEIESEEVIEPLPSALPLLPLE